MGSPACAAPRCSASVGLPHHVQELHHFLVDDEDYGHVHTHPTQPGNGALVEPGWDYLHVRKTPSGLDYWNGILTGLLNRCSGFL